MIDIREASMTRNEAFLAACPVAREFLRHVRCGFSATTWRENTAVARRAARTGGRELDLLAWSRKYLPAHFTRPPSNLHRWLAEELDAMQDAAGLATERARPARICQIDHRHDGLPLAGGVGGLGAVHLDRLRHAAPGLRHLENIKAELLDNRLLAEDYPQARRARARSGGQARSCFATAWQSRRSARGSGFAAAAAAPHRPTLIVCDDLQNDGHIRLGRATRPLAELVSRHADEGGHGADQRRQPGHRLAPRRPGDGAAPPAGMEIAAVQGDSALAGEHVALGAVGEPCSPTWRTPAIAAPRGLSTSSGKRRWTPAPSCSGRRRKTFTR